VPSRLKKEEGGEHDLRTIKKSLLVGLGEVARGELRKGPSREKDRNVGRGERYYKKTLNKRGKWYFALMGKGGGMGV